MRKPRSIRVVLYAVNGTGVGHLTRLVAISRWLRRYANHAHVRAEIFFLTSSEADGMLFAERFAAFKIPSKTSIGEAGVDRLAYVALAKQWIWHSLGLLRPDLLVVDTFPRGSFGELLSALDLCRHKAFIYRPLKPEIAERADFQAMLPLYDSILVPERAGDVQLPFPESVRAKTLFIGPVASRERAELYDRGQARLRLGISDGKKGVFVSAGGGGDKGAEEQLHAVCAALGGDENIHLVIGAGPLYRGRPCSGARLTWLPGNAAELMNGFEVAVCAAGYNTFVELMHAGVPAIFLPQEKAADDQVARARRAVDSGAAIMLSSLDSAALQSALAHYASADAHAAAVVAARSLVPHNHARTVAAELLRLVLPPADVDAAQEGVTDATLAPGQ